MKKYILRTAFFSDFEFTTRENYEAYIGDARASRRFYKRDGFNTFEDVLEYIERCFGISRDDIEIIDNAHAHVKNNN